MACLRPSSPGTKQTPASTPPVWLRGNSCGYPPPAPFAPFVVVIVDVVRSTSRGRREREREREATRHRRRRPRYRGSRSPARRPTRPTRNRRRRSSARRARVVSRAIATARRRRRRPPPMTCAASTKQGARGDGARAEPAVTRVSAVKESHDKKKRTADWPAFVTHARCAFC